MLTIRTTYTPPDALPPYADAVGDEGLIRYKYRGTDPRSRREQPDRDRLAERHEVFRAG